ncbi:MAG: pyridoxamine 5'-phosphate oxidase family protein [Firmicutes bacterium]|nr:pyridoxamine 5'-phosphate oxidase family protein [Bacillota bacterium]
MKDKEKTIGAIADYQKTAFIASVDTDGFPHMRAMLKPRKREGIKKFWFTTNTSSIKISHYKENPKASIYFCDNRFMRGVLLMGNMEVLTDEKSKQMIWQQGDEMYYPLGVTDPDYAVLKFTAEKGRYYHSFNVEEFEC